MHKRGLPEMFFLVVLIGGAFFFFGLLLSPYITGPATGKVIAHISESQITAGQNRFCVQQPGLRYVNVDSPSMEPLINTHTLLAEKTPTSPLDIQEGDIISFYEPLGKQNILHVVTEVVPTDNSVSYRTRGWANTA